MDKNRHVTAMVSADLFANLAVVFMVAVGTLAPLVHTEVLTHMEKNKKERNEASNQPEAGKSALMELIYVPDEADLTDFRVLLPGKKEQLHDNVEQAIQAIVAASPQHLRVRGDNRVPLGNYTRVLDEVSSTGTRVWRSEDAR